MYRIITDSSANLPEDWLERLKATGKIRDVLVHCYEPVTGSHLGPGALALFYWADQPLKP